MVYKVAGLLIDKIALINQLLLFLNLINNILIYRKIKHTICIIKYEFTKEVK